MDVEGAVFLSTTLPPILARSTMHSWNNVFHAARVHRHLQKGAQQTHPSLFTATPATSIVASSFACMLPCPIFNMKGRGRSSGYWRHFDPFDEYSDAAAAESTTPRSSPPVVAPPNQTHPTAPSGALVDTGSRPPSLSTGPVTSEEAEPTEALRSLPLDDFPALPSFAATGLEQSQRNPGANVSEKAKPTQPFQSFSLDDFPLLLSSTANGLGLSQSAPGRDTSEQKQYSHASSSTVTDRTIRPKTNPPASLNNTLCPEHMTPRGAWETLQPDEGLQENVDPPVQDLDGQVHSNDQPKSPRRDTLMSQTDFSGSKLDPASAPFSARPRRPARRLSKKRCLRLRAQEGVVDYVPSHPSLYEECLPRLANVMPADTKAEIDHHLVCDTNITNFVTMRILLPLSQPYGWRIRPMTWCVVIGLYIKAVGRKYLLDAFSNLANILPMMGREAFLKGVPRRISKDTHDDIYNARRSLFLISTFLGPLCRGREPWHPDSTRDYRWCPCIQDVMIACVAKTGHSGPVIAALKSYSTVDFAMRYTPLGGICFNSDGIQSC
ncbi:hypothetical protein BCR34DRAFT_593393 [Clohesyomyces aquaticus]|uniref:Uncharacterized protein n=1 Tax=Clohesyomyces aquaticus TaxID=1231657 RepID=A0A1Y1YIE5_9PLEO|nr:hypothetical protein BCR34DRAFT_593393 [Clohesyomyces aquaticus]